MLLGKIPMLKKYNFFYGAQVKNEVALDPKVEFEENSLIHKK